MATNSAAIAHLVLDALETLNIDYAIVHNEEDVARGMVTSDVDIIVNCHPREVLRRVSAHLALEAAPLFLWPYDVNSVSSFWFTPDLSQGTQIDLLFDVEGRAKYGILTSRMIDRRQRGTKYWRLDELSATAYRLSKRSYKDDPGRLAEALTVARVLDPSLHDLQQILNGSRAATLHQLIAGKIALSGPSVPYRLRTVARILERLVRPMGATVFYKYDGAEPEGIRSAKQTVAAVLVSTMSIRLPRGSQWLKILWHRRKPSMVFVGVDRPDSFSLLKHRFIVLDLRTEVDPAKTIYRQLADDVAHQL